MNTLGEVREGLVELYGMHVEGNALRINLEDGRYVLLSALGGDTLPGDDALAIDLALRAPDGTVLDDPHYCDVTCIEDVLFHYSEGAVRSTARECMK